jgi:hypothetical protein
MSNVIEFPAPVREDGTTVSAEEIRAQAETPKLLPFKYEGVTYHVAVLRSRIKAGAVLRYRASAAQWQSKREGFDPADAERAQELAKSVHGLKEDEIKELLSPEDYAFLSDFGRKVSLIQTEDEPELFPQKLDIVTQAIVDWSYPLVKPARETLEGNGALAEAVVNSVWKWYDPSSDDSEAEAATTPNPNTHNSSSGS